MFSYSAPVSMPAKYGSESPIAMSPSASYGSPLRSTSHIFKPQGPAAKLEHVAERFSHFYNDLEQEKQSKRQFEDSRFKSLTETVLKLEKSLEAEIKRRVEADKQLQAHFDSEVRSVQDRAQLQLVELQSGMKSSLDGITRTLHDLHSIIRDEREQRRADVEHLAQNLVNKVNECVAALDDERVSRLDREAATLKKVGEDIFRLQERVEGEKSVRDSDISHLRNEIHDALGNRNLSDEKFQALVLEEIQNIKATLNVERDERIAEDDEIVQAVNDYTRALQDGLRIVGSP